MIRFAPLVRCDGCETLAEPEVAEARRSLAARRAAAAELDLGGWGGLLQWTTHA